MSNNFIKRTIPFWILSFTAIIMVIDYYFANPFIAKFAGLLQSWSSIAVAFSLGHGLINVTIVNGLKFIKRERGIFYWPFNLWTIIVTYVTLFVALIPPIGANPYIGWVNQVPRLALSASITSLVGFYIVSASYRAFRARNIESTAMLISAILVLLYFAPIGETIWSGFPIIGRWLMDYPNNATMKVIIITGSIGLIQLCLRAITGKEKVLIEAE